MAEADSTAARVEVAILTFIYSENIFFGYSSQDGEFKPKRHPHVLTRFLKPQICHEIDYGRWFFE